MNKSELAQKVMTRDRAGMRDLETITAAERVVEHVLGAIEDEVCGGGKVCVSGFGTIYAFEKKARLGTNPHTRQPMQIPAHMAVKFKPAKSFLNALNA